MDYRLTFRKTRKLVIYCSTSQESDSSQCGFSFSSQCGLSFNNCQPIQNVMGVS